MKAGEYIFRGWRGGGGWGGGGSGVGGMQLFKIVFAALLKRGLS